MWNAVTRDQSTIGVRHELGEERELRVAGGEHHVGRAALGRSRRGSRRAPSAAAARASACTSSKTRTDSSSAVNVAGSRELREPARRWPRASRRSSARRDRSRCGRRAGRAASRRPPRRGCREIAASTVISCDATTRRRHSVSAAGVRPWSRPARPSPLAVTIDSTTASAGRSGHWPEFGRLSGKSRGLSRRNESIIGATISPDGMCRHLGDLRAAWRTRPCSDRPTPRGRRST